MRVFKRRPSPAMIVAVVALIVSIGGTAGAGPIAEISLSGPEKKQIRKITRKISNRVANRRITKRAPGLAVAKANLADLATNAKNAESADSAKSVDPAAFGVALAGINVNADGSINSWFNRLGGKPSVNVVETGLYDITYPGISIDTDGDNVVQQASVRAASFNGELRISGFEGDARIRTSNSAGSAAALPFNHVVYGAVPGP